jgi:hypothetical protein
MMTYKVTSISFSGDYLEDANKLLTKHLNALAEEGWTLHPSSTIARQDFWGGVNELRCTLVLERT